MKHMMLLIIFLFSYSSVSAVYQWTDEQGITHFSDNDNKTESATEIEVQLTPPSIDSLPQPKQTATNSINSAASSTNDMPLAATTISITHPIDQQTLRSNNGEITVTTMLSTTLQYGSTIRLLIDGVIHSEQIETQFNVTNIPIGTHKIQLQIINNIGKVIASSELITVYLHRFKAN